MSIQLPEIQPRSLYLVGDLEQNNISEISKKIINVNEKDQELKRLSSIYGMEYTPKPIKLFIESYGGDLIPTMGLVGVIEQSLTPVHTISIGAAMSCGFMILIAGHKRFCYEHSTPLYHQISGWKFGDLKTINEKVKQSKKNQKWLEQYTLSKTKMTKKSLKKIFRGKKDFYMDANKALELGVVDRIIK